MLPERNTQLAEFSLGCASEATDPACPVPCKTTPMPSETSGARSARVHRSESWDRRITGGLTVNQALGLGLAETRSRAGSQRLNQVLHLG